MTMKWGGEPVHLTQRTRILLWLLALLAVIVSVAVGVKGDDPCEGKTGDALNVCARLYYG